jgi:hypothetical protein
MLSLRKDVGKKLGSGISTSVDLVANTTSNGLEATGDITLHADSRATQIRGPSVAKVATAVTLSGVDAGADTLRRIVGATTLTYTATWMGEQPGRLHFQPQAAVSTAWPTAYPGTGTAVLV